MPDPADGPAATASDDPVLARLDAETLRRLTERALANGRSPTQEAHALLVLALADRPDPRADGEYLVSRLGSTFVAALTGSSDFTTPARWASADGPLPGQHAAERLARGRRLWAEVSTLIGEASTREWFLRHHRALGGDTPLVAVRDGRDDQLREAVAQLSG